VAPSCFDSFPTPTGDATSSAHELDGFDGVKDVDAASSFDAGGPVMRSAREPLALGVSDMVIVCLGGKLKSERRVKRRLRSDWGYNVRYCFRPKFNSRLWNDLEIM